MGTEKLCLDLNAPEYEANRRNSVLQIIQPGFEGVMDGSVSTLAPMFAAAFATRNNRTAFVIGLPATLGAGISMGFAGADSDDGSITGRGQAWVHGIVCGLMPDIGGIGPPLPLLISNFHVPFSTMEF
jgi:erythrin-vacuolar iron transport family protein